jgi:peptidoglycan/LPS O-acetylase OafA/YrhL
MRLLSENLWAPYNASAIYIYTVLGLATSAFILFVASNNNGYICRFLNSDFLVFFGKISFSFYVWHIFPLDIASKFSHNIAMLMILGLILTTAIGYLSYRVIEQPFMNLSQRLAH